MPNLYRWVAQRGEEAAGEDARKDSNRRSTGWEAVWAESSQHALKTVSLLIANNHLFLSGDFLSWTQRSLERKVSTIILTVQRGKAV